MKNSLTDLNNYLFEQIERLQDDSLDDAALEKEIRRGEAVTSVAETIIENAGMQLRAAKFASEMGIEVKPTIALSLTGSTDTDGAKKSRKGGVTEDAEKNIPAGA